MKKLKCWVKIRKSKNNIFAFKHKNKKVVVDVESIAYTNPKKYDALGHTFSSKENAIRYVKDYLNRNDEC